MGRPWTLAGLRRLLPRAKQGLRHDQSGASSRMMDKEQGEMRQKPKAAGGTHTKPGFMEERRQLGQLRVPLFCRHLGRQRSSVHSLNPGFCPGPGLSLLPSPLQELGWPPGSFWRPCLPLALSPGASRKSVVRRSAWRPVAVTALRQV